MKKIHLILAVLIGCVANVTWAAEATAASFRAVASGRNDVVYLAPAMAYYEAMPIGNGRLGGMLRNLPDGLACQLNHVSFFAGSGAENNLMTTGEVSIRLPRDWVGGFVEQRLVLYDGVIRTTYRKGASTLTVTTWMVEGADALAVHLACNEKLPGIQVALGVWDRLTPEYAKQNMGLNEIPNIKPPVFGVTDGAPSMIQPGMERSAAMLAGAAGGTWSGVKAERLFASATLQPEGKELTILVAAPVVFDKPADAAVLAAAQRIVADFKGKGIAKARADHDAYWHSFWNKTGVLMSSDDGLADYAENMYHLFLYWMAGCSRGADAPKFNGANYIFCSDWRSWGGWYWYQNTREMYWALPAAGHAELCAPLIDLYWRTLPASKMWAKTLFNAPGAAVQETLSPRTGHGCKNNNPGTVLYHTTSTEVAFQMFQYYHYTGDESFLRERAYPFLKEVLAFHLSFLKKEDDGKYHVSLSSARESYRYIKDSVTDLSALRATLPLAIAASEKLGEDVELRAKWNDILGNLALYVIDQDDGTLAPGTFLPPDMVSPYPAVEKVLPPGPIRSKDKADRKNAENVTCDPIYPWGIFSLSSSPADIALARNTFAVRPSAWCYGNAWDWSAPSAARLGLGDEVAKLVRIFIANDQFFPSGFCGTPGNMPDCWGRKIASEGGFDAPGVLAVTVQEMQLQSHDHLIRVYPAWPKGWQSEFTLMAKGGFRVSSAIQTDGGIPFVVVESPRGGTCRLVNPWAGRAVVAVNGKTKTTRDRIIQVETRPGDTLELKPDEPVSALPVIDAVRNDGPKLLRKLAAGETVESVAKNSSAFGMLGIAKDGSNPARVISGKALAALKRKPGETAPMRRAAKPVVTAFRVGTAPVIDGDLTDACWRDREAIGPFLRLGTNLMAQEQTQFRIAWDDENLYVAALCHESHPGEVSAAAGEDTWAQEDNIELFLGGANGRYWQICLNAKGGKNDLMMLDGKSDAGRNLKITRVAKIGNDGWTLEAAIPLKELGLAAPAAGVEWAFNVARNELPNRELSTFAPLGKTAFHLPAEFARLRLSAQAPGPQPLAVFSFDGDGEAATFDSSGMGWIGKFVGDAAIAPGKEGNGLRLDGKGYFEVPFSPFFVADDELTVDVWVRPENKGARVVDTGKAGRELGFMLDLYPDNQVRWLAMGGPLQARDVSVPTGAWTRITATVSNSKGEKAIYVNGEPKAGNPGAGSGPTRYRPNEFINLPLRIGADSDGASTFKGMIDSVRIYRSVKEP